MAVHVVIHHVTVNELLHSPTGAVMRDALRRARNVQAVARRLAPRRTGRLAASIEVETRFSFRGGSVRVGSRLRYARVAHDGRGPVRVERGRALAFTTRGGDVVFARSADAAAGTHYLARALPAAR